MTPINLEPSWKEKLSPEFQKPYMRALKDFLVREKSRGAHIYPPGAAFFRAFSLTPFEKVKVVILGQDPYHAPGQAHGLCFSVPQQVPLPPSLINIYKELKADLGCAASSGNLEHWAKQGVLLLNAVLSVEHKKPASHQGKGWEQFTDQAIMALNKERTGLVFMLWGSYAQRKGAFIDANRHCVLKAAHPSPLSAYRGFFGCRHFSKANDYLIHHNLSPISW